MIYSKSPNSLHNTASVCVYGEEGAAQSDNGQLERHISRLYGAMQ